ncbi:hypothetical protein P692DRAFT_20822972 [Suillus brevipes Sb2]|nr:hypothetical protein P692DRAFT_20822972 [Suillus brevipes Sb2]
MARPVIHTTTEAKRIAAREKRARYYTKHRETILKRHRELRSSNSKEARAEAKFSKDLCKALKKALPVSDGDESMSESDNDSDHSSDDENNLYKMKHDLDDQMMEMVGDDPCTFTKDIVHLYVQSLLVDDCSTKGDITIIENAMTKVQKLLNHAIPAQDQILNFCGISPEWHVTDSVTRFLRTVLAYLEDILSLVMFEGASGLAEAEFLGELLYQKGSRI